MRLSSQRSELRRLLKDRTSIHGCAVRKKHEPPQSALGKALQYFTNHQLALGRLLDYGDLPLDNGIVERLHVRAALRRSRR